MLKFTTKIRMPLTLTLSKAIFLSVWFVWFPISIISVSIICVSQEWLRLVEFNQQIYGFYKEVSLDT